MPQGDFQVDPTNLQIVIGNESIPDTHIVDIIKYLRNAHLGTVTQPKGTKEVLYALAKTNLAPTSVSTAPEIREYLSFLKKQPGATTPVALAKKLWTNVTQTMLRGSKKSTSK